jgi:hypothetical protein
VVRGAQRKEVITINQATKELLRQYEQLITKEKGVRQTILSNPSNGIRLARILAQKALLTLQIQDQKKK